MAVYPTLKVELALDSTPGAFDPASFDNTAGTGAFDTTDANAEFVDVTTDVLLDQGFKFRYGMAGGGPTDRVASTGWLTFSLNNDVSNSGAKLGYYSPLHANLRSGFGFGIGVRVSFKYAGTTYYKWRGSLSEISPVPGKKRERVTRCMAVDWMNEPGNYAVRDVTLQLSQRSDQVFSAVLAKITKQPAVQSIGAGKDSYTYALDNIGQGQHPPAASVFQDIAMSELGFIFVKGNSVQGGTLVFENRHARPLTTTSALNFSDDMTGVDVPRTLDRIWNRVEVMTHPKSVDAAATTVLVNLLSTPVVQPGETITIWENYRDPSQQLSLVGGTAMVAPVATTDYTANTASDGSGTDLTANVTVTATFFAATVKLVIVNTGVTTVYMTKLQCRGKGLYDYQPELSVSEDTVAQATQGLRALQVDMPYQDSRVNGQGAADWLRSLYSTAQRQVNTVVFTANDTAALLTAALAQEISARVGVQETVTGVTSTGTRGHFINAVEYDVRPTALGPFIVCTWTLAPADATQSWILEDAIYGVLDSTTILGYL